MRHIFEDKKEEKKKLSSYRSSHSVKIKGILWSWSHLGWQIIMEGRAKIGRIEEMIFEFESKFV